MTTEDIPLPPAVRKAGSRRRKALAALVPVLLVTVLLARGNRLTRSADLSALVVPGAAKGFNVLLVTLDTTRPDHLGCYGCKTAQTPAIDSLCARGVRFANATTSVPMTGPSHATILTGLYPPHHGVRTNGLHRLPESVLTLPEIVQAQGYDTAAFVSCFVLDERFGFGQGFARYDFRVSANGYHSNQPDTNERPANEVTDAALGWLSDRQKNRSTQPFFLWVHYYDPHLPHTSPLGALPEFAGRGYDAEIAFVDKQFKRLLDGFRKHSLLERTLIVCASDHGESFGEHEEHGHGLLIYEPTMAAAIILSCPALFKQDYQVSKPVVGLVDISATVQDLLGVEPVVAGDGLSLFRAANEADRAIYLETTEPLTVGQWSPLYGLRRRADKYVLAPDQEYYNLANDPAEADNLFATASQRVAPLAEQLAALMQGWGDGTTGAEAGRSVSQEELERLAALGYVSVQQKAPSGPLPDPKAMIPLFNQTMKGIRLYNEGKYDEALPVLTEVVSQCETMLGPSLTLARIHLRQNRPEEAVALLRRIMERNPNPETIRCLAEVLVQARRFSEAEDLLKTLEGLNPESGQVPLIRGDMLALQRRFAEAIVQFERALKLDERRIGPEAREKIEVARNHLAGEAAPPPAP